MESLVPITDDWRPAELAAAPVERSERPAIWAVAAFAVVDLAIFLYVVVAGFVRQPYSDMFDFIRAEFLFERTGDLFAYLASPHNGQYLIWIRFLTAMDIRVFHGASVIFAVAACAAVLGAALAVAVELWGSVQVRAVGILAALLTVPLIAASLNALDVTQPINTVYAFAFGFMALAVILFERAGADPGRRTILLTTLSLLAGVLAVAGSAAGVAVWPVLIASAARHPGNRRLIVPTLLAGVVVMAVVARGLLSGAAPGSPQGAVGHAWKMIEYVILYCGMPWSMVPLLSRVRVIIGLATIALGAALLWRGARREGSAGRLERIGLDLMLFALITAAMAGLGRADQSEALAVPMRYAIFMSAYQVGLVCVLAPLAAEHWPSVKRLALPVALAASLALFAQQVVAANSCLRYSNYERNLITAFAAGVRTPDMWRQIYPGYDVALQVQADCRRRGLYQ